tara:strand:- start:978 stop:1487 length:510 start_codon:yes stop_codon:yes gene_type:complete
MNIKQSIIILSIFFIPIFCFAQNMDKTIDRFYVNYNHPIIRQGANLLGTIILQNNNNEGFTLKLVSENGGVLKVNNSTHGSNDINYYITFERGTGRIGSGVGLNENENWEGVEAEMLTDYIILQTTNQTSSTDIAIKVYLNIDEDVSDLLMAGNYRDEIEVIYNNNNPL